MANIAITKGYNNPTGFVSGETITPAKLNSAQSPGATISDIVDADISASAAIAASKLASTLDLTGKTVTLPASSVTTASIAGAAVTAAKLDGAQTGSAPIYGARAWVNFDGTTADNLSGTYTRTGTDVTITATAHGLIVGNVVRLDFTSGGALDGTYTVTQRDDDNTFHITTAASGTILTGSVTVLRRLIKAAGNVSSVTYLNTLGDYAVNFSQAMPDADYIVAAGGRIRASYVLDSPAPTAQAFYLTATDTTFAGANFSSVHCAIFR
jgi:hypothetical protein